MNFRTTGDERSSLDGATGALFVTLSRALKIEACLQRTTCFVRHRGFSPKRFGHAIRDAWTLMSPATADDVKSNIALCWYARERGFSDFNAFREHYDGGGLAGVLQEDMDDWLSSKKKLFSGRSPVRLIAELMKWRNPSIMRVEADFCTEPIRRDNLVLQRELNVYLFKLINRVCRSVYLVSGAVRQVSNEYLKVKFTTEDQYCTI